MIKWEYQWVPGRRPDLEELTNTLGLLGWESYAVTEVHNMRGQSTGNYTVFMKRQIPDNKEQE